MTPDTPADPLIGNIVSERYRVLERIGRGGFGAVYRVQHVRLDKILALKVLFEHAHQNPRMIKRFEREARATCRIGHENIVEITDFARDRSIGYYFVMELLEGETLGERLNKLGPMTAPRVVHIAKQMADALAATHNKGIVHRDLKPENIFLTQKRGRDDFVKLVDFGIAAMVDFDEHEPRLTSHGTMLGTPSYMSPEQARGKRADHRSDIYSFGVILYELVTGQVPFSNTEPMVVLEMHRSTPPVPPTVRRPELNIPSELERIIMRALRKSTAQRYQSMREVYTDLDALGATLDMTTLEAVRRRVDNEGHRAAERHEREEPEWLDEDLLLIEPKPTAPVPQPPLLLSEVDTTMPMSVDPETPGQSQTVPMSRPQVSDELPEVGRRGQGNNGVRAVSPERSSAAAGAILPQAGHSKSERTGSKSPWERTAKQAHLEPVPKLSNVSSMSQRTRPVDTISTPTRLWHSPLVMTLLGFLATFAAYLILTDGFNSDTVETNSDVEVTGKAREQPPVGASSSQRQQVPSPSVRPDRTASPQKGAQAEQASTAATASAPVVVPPEPASVPTQPAQESISSPVVSARGAAYSSAKPRRKTESRVAQVRLVLRSKPSGASVYIDGEAVGITPVEVSVSRSRIARTIRFEKDGVTKKKVVTPFEAKTVTARLVKPAEGRRNSGGGNYDLY